MILNLGSLAFNANIEGGGGTPAWGTELGQGEGYRFQFEDAENFLTSMLYMSIPDKENIYCPLGKGGGRKDDYEFVVGSIYDKIFVNGHRVPNAKFILLIVKQINGDYHIGRRSLKYNPRMTYNGQAYNEECYKRIPAVLGINDDAAWFVDEIYTENQDELHFTAYVLDAQQAKHYHSNEERKKDFQSKIETDKSVNRLSERYTFQYDSPFPLQQIYFGAPGTGKSHTIKVLTEPYRDTTIRTTFHPDSDYSSFVGCYKPTMQYVEQTYIVEGEQKPVLDAQTKEKVCKQEIVYAYTPQAFLQAYMMAWQRLQDGTPVFLIIEEINRGNCAQIFGDLFQLLDRDKGSGYSEYPIRADRDMQTCLQAAFAEHTDLPENIRTGQELQLPPNLHIWATMNTSDQSLFPIDSAFKRRWQWRYCPIVNMPDLHYHIQIGGQTFDWWQVIEHINQAIEDTTKSEDKKLGYFFVQDDGGGIISVETFVNKVVFYLWNDVFKDAYSNTLFTDGQTFYRFFCPDGEIDMNVVVQFLEHIVGNEA